MRRFLVVAAGVVLVAQAGMASFHATSGSQTGVKPLTTTGGDVYVSNLFAQTVSQYAVGTTGQLAGLSPTTLSTAPLTPGELDLNPTGTNLYVSLIDLSGGGHDAIGEYSVGAGGVLTALSTPSVPTAPHPIEIVITPDGKFLYVDNLASDFISQYSIGSGGALTALSPATVTPAAGAGELVISPNGKFLYALSDGLHASGGTSQFSIGTNGQLTPLTTAVAGSGIITEDAKITPDGKFLYAAGAQVSPAVAGMFEFSIDATGQLTLLTPSSVAAGTLPLEVVMTSDGKFVYATSAITCGQNCFNSAIAQFSVGSNGQLTALAPPTVSTGNQAIEAVITPDNKFLYVGNFTSTGNPDTVSEYGIGSGGQLSALTPPTISTGAGAGALAATPSTAITPPPPSCIPDEEITTATNHTLTGSVPGSLNLSGGTWTITNAQVSGAVTVAAKTNITINNSTIRGSVVTSNGDAVSICGSTIGGALTANSHPASVSVCSSTFHGAMTVNGSKGFVVVGDPGDDNCGVNNLTSLGSNNFVNNTGDVELVGNTITGSVSLTGNSGTGPFTEDSGPEIEGNAIAGSLSCIGNSPAPINDTVANSVGGARAGQCSAAGF